MNIEEKAKAYEEALKRAKAAIDIAADKDLVKGVATTIFPELRESEDERIRKEIINYLDFAESHNLLRAADYEKKKGWLAYLEKQKEQKPNPSNSVGLEQKPAEWIEDYNEENLQTRFAFYTYKDDPSTLYLSNVFVEEASRNHGFGTRILKAAEKVAEAIGAITICLKVKQDSPANAWYRKHGYGYVAFEDWYDWLEKNLEYLKPVKKEWSEEDEKIRKTLLDYYEESLDNYTCVEWLNGITYGELCDWLKSLRPQPHWKPSDEQMNHLSAAVIEAQRRHNESVNGFPRYRVLKELYEQLKKLM